MTCLDITVASSMVHSVGRARPVSCYSSLDISLQAVSLKVTETVIGNTGGTLNSIECSSGVVKFIVSFYGLFSIKLYSSIGKRTG